MNERHPLDRLLVVLCTLAIFAAACSSGAGTATDAPAEVLEARPEVTATTQAVEPETTPDSAAEPAPAADDETAPSPDDETAVDPRWETGANGPIPAGTIRLPEFGGIQFDLDAERTAYQDRGFTILRTQERPVAVEVNLLAPTATPGGSPLTTVEELVTALTDVVGADLTEVAPIGTPLGAARTFDFEVDADRVEPDAGYLEVADSGWGPWPYGRLSLLDTERGLFMVTAETQDPASEVYAETVATADALLATLELVEIDGAATGAEVDVLSEDYLASVVESVWIPEDAGALLVSVVDGDGQAMYAATGSDGAGTEPTPGDAFRVGSITKVFTSVLTLSLVEDGLVDLDASAAQYMSTVDVPADVRVRDLLQHTSGIASYTDESSFFDEVRQDDARVWTPAEVFEVVADSPAQFAPGSDWAYSNTNYLLLGMLIEEVTGDRYTAALDDLVVGPLDLASTYVAGFDEGPEPFPAYTGFFGDASAPFTNDFTSTATSAWSGGAMVSSAEDLHEFFTALFAGDLVAAELVEEMTANDEYGLGVERHLSDEGDELFGHSGGIPGYHTFVLHSPDSGRTAFWAGTADAVNPFETVEAVIPVLTAG